MVYSGLTEDEKEDYDFAYKELDTIDSKAGNILLVGSILIVISTLSVLFTREANILTRIVGTGAVIVTLISVAFCTDTMKIEWSDSFQVNELKNARDKRTKKIHKAIKTLTIALVLYVSMFVVDLIVTYCEICNVSK